MTKISYPLAEVIVVKKRRVEVAEQVLREKQEILRKEQEILEQRKAERDQVVRHHDDKLLQLRDELDHSTTSPKIQQMKAYLKVVKERVAQENKKVQDQEGQVAIAQKNVDLAREDLNRKRLEVDKLESHKKDWEKEMRRELEIVMGREQDEIGSVVFNMKQRQNV
jgi:hypothetical protein